jgi:hypothetical protein
MNTNATPKVTVVDGLMGCGKTTHAIRRMAEMAHNGQSFIYITPFLKQVTRVKDHELRDKYGVTNVVDPKPTPASRGQDAENKSAHLLKLLAGGENIVTTHRLLEVMDAQALGQIALLNYVLIVDEVTQWVQKYKGMKLKDVKMLMGAGYISVEPTSRRVLWHDVDGEPYDGKFQGFRSLVLRVVPVRRLLTIVVGLLPQWLQGCAPQITALRARLMSGEALMALRELARLHLHALVRPLGFLSPPLLAGERKAGFQHDMGPDPPQSFA